ncbi:MAG TPA: hypothetical protein PKN22_01230 [Taishania sp.]|nr:hypothetical protein [Taishania sp.]
MTKTSETITNKPRRKTNLEIIEQQRQAIRDKEERMQHLILHTLERYREKSKAKDKFDNKFYYEILNYVLKNKNQDK